LPQSSFFSVTPIWNNVENIFDCLTILDNFVDKLIICEGKWIGYEGDLRSTDGTLDEIVRFIKGAKHEVIFMMLPRPMHQYEVRNLMVDKVPTDSWFIIVDSDEVIVKYPKYPIINELLKLNTKGRCILAYDETQGENCEGQLMDLPKIWHKVDGLHYTKNHRYLDVGDTPIIYNPKDFPACRDFVCMHKGAHKATRQQAEDYKNWLINFEYDKI